MRWNNFQAYLTLDVTGFFSNKSPDQSRYLTVHDPNCRQHDNNAGARRQLSDLLSRRT